MWLRPSKRLRPLWKKRQIEATKSPMASNMAGYYCRLPADRNDQVVDFIGGTQLLASTAVTHRATAATAIPPISQFHKYRSFPSA